jgi:hypothetical protein
MKTTKYLGRRFSGGAYTSPEWDQFVRDVRSDILSMLKGSDWGLHNLSGGHYYFSAFLHNIKTDKWMYISCSDVRFFPDEWAKSLLIREAKHDKDYTGGPNGFCRFDKIPYFLGLKTLDSLPERV